MLRLDSVVADTKLEARPYQSRIVTKATDMFRGLHRNAANELEPVIKSVCIESPTGSGKTAMGLLAAKYLERILAAQGEQLTVAWIAMRRNLLKQANDENINKCVNVENFVPVSMFDHEPTKILEAKRAGHKILTVMDESQHDAASSCAHLHNVIEPDWILGLSATPFRLDRQKLCFEKVIKDAGIHQLIADGWLSKYQHYSIDNWTPECVADRYCAEPDRWGKSIFYFVNTQQCYELATILRRRGHVCDVVTGETDCEAQIEEFREGRLPCLINCMKLTEGFDDPSLFTAWVRDSSRGPTMQMGGRVFRLFADLPFKQIVQSKNTRWPFIKTALPTDQYLWQSNEWRSLTINPKLNLINKNARLAIARSVVELPELVRNKQSKARRVRY